MPSPFLPRLHQRTAAAVIALSVWSATATLLLWSATATAAADQKISALAAAEKQPLLATLEELVGIESGSRDLEGLDRLAALIASKLKSIGAEVELIEPGSAATPDVYRMHDTPPKVGKMVKGTFKGSGKAKVMLIAHMDTVYPRGMLAKQPFRIDGDKVYGLGISDDKQGIAVILHGISMLQKLNFTDYGTLTVLINGDEEISSPGSRSLITQLASEQEAVMSFEASSASEDKLSLATSGIGSASLVVQGKASHAGASPERGVNALYELAHQVLQLRDLSDPDRGIKVNWTIAKAGTTRNVIPAEASASADVRVVKAEDLNAVEARIKERVRTQLLPEAKVTVQFEQRRPPLAATAASVALAERAQAIYSELDRKLGADSKVTGGGTDAAFAGLGNANTAVIERFGLQGFGAHSADAEYVLMDSIEPRLYLFTRLIMSISAGEAGLAKATGARN